MNSSIFNKNVILTNKGCSPLTSIYFSIISSFILQRKTVIINQLHKMTTNKFHHRLVCRVLIQTNASHHFYEFLLNLSIMKNVREAQKLCNDENFE